MIAGVMSLVLQLLLHRPRAANGRRRPRRSSSCRRRCRWARSGVARLRHAGGGDGAQGQRSGAALLDRQGDGGAAVPAGARGPYLPRQVVHRHRRLPARRCGRRPGVLFFAAVLGWSPMQMSGVVLIALGGWFWAAYVARRQYVENLRESIHQHRVDSERASLPVMDRVGRRHDRVAAEGVGERDPLRAQPVRDGARPQGAPGGPRPAASRVAGGPGAGGPAAARERATRDDRRRSSGCSTIRISTCAPRRCCT